MALARDRSHRVSGEGRRMSAASDESDDLDLISRGERSLRVLRAPHDLGVHLDRDAGGLDAERGEQTIERQAVFDLALLTVHVHAHHEVDV
jgi:hypothetical protein